MARAAITIISGLMAASLVTAAASASTVIDEWTSVKAPPPPKLESIKADPTTTALLMLDFNKPPCDPETRPRCAATIPAAQSLLDKAKAKGLFLVFTLGGGGTVNDIDTRLKPTGGEPVFSAGPDKFFNTDLDKILKAKGIKTVITMGAASNGAILYTASEAAFRDYQVVVPIDGVSGATPYAEQFTLWQLVNGPRLAEHVKLTRTDMIGF
jgi:nicotinamidase-related amidase